MQIKKIRLKQYKTNTVSECFKFFNNELSTIQLIRILRTKRHIFFYYITNYFKMITIVI